VLKWIGISLCMLLAAAFGLSSRRAVCWGNANASYQLKLAYGAVEQVWRYQGWRAEAGQPSLIPGWMAFRYDGSANGTASFWFWWPLGGSTGRTRWFALPLWMPFVALAVPTLILWWLDRRRIPPGHCQNCGYDLTGTSAGAARSAGRACRRQ
jgi:hypothetical protein